MNVQQKIGKAEELNADQKQEFIFQFICKETGVRSEPFNATWKNLADILRSRDPEKNPKPTDDDYILLVAVMDKKQTHIPTSPLLTVSRFLDIQPEK